jgi:hypothetical protein
MSVQHSDDLHAAAEELSGTPGVVDAGVFADSTTGVRVEAVMAPRFDGIPAHVTHVLADHNVTITDVSPQGEPTHYIRTVQ